MFKIYIKGEKQYWYSERVGMTDVFYTKRSAETKEYSVYYIPLKKYV